MRISTSAAFAALVRILPDLDKMDAKGKVREVVSYFKSSHPSSRRSKALYDPLDKSQPTIRLLEVMPSARHDDIVKCRLITVLAERHPEYIALSYMWGDASDTEDIIVNGHVVTATRNLASALQHMRTAILPKTKWWRARKRLPSRFWADAICINQEDTEEKNHQVQLMGSIYSMASLVISWLGSDEDGELGLAIKAFNVIGRELESLGGAPYNVEWMQKYPWLVETGEDSVDNRAWTAMNSFFDRPYWYRVWILQEMALAPKLWVMSGTSIVEYKSLEYFNQLLEMFGSRDISLPVDESSGLGYLLSAPGVFDMQPLSFIRYFEDIVLYRQKMRDPDAGALFDLCKRSLTLTWRCQATDPRDKIFAFQGLMGNVIQPDYNKSALDVYCELASKWISHSSRSLELLLYSGRGFGLPDKFGLPSWVVDWQGISSGAVLAHFSLLIFATHDGLSEHCVSKSCVLDNLYLKVPGCICNTVTEVEPSYEQSSDELLQFCRDYVRRKSGAKYPTGIPPLQAVLRTLTFDCFLTSERVRLDDLGPLEVQQALLATLWAVTPHQSQDIISEDLCARMEDLGTPSGKHVRDFLQEVLPGVAIDDRSALVNAMLALIRVFLPKVATQLNTLLEHYSLFHTSGGYLGMAPGRVRVGDVVCVLQDCGFPVLLRKEEDLHYVHVGPCFVLGFMDGEAARLVKKGELNIQEFEIH